MILLPVHMGSALSLKLILHTSYDNTVYVFINHILLF